LGRDSTSEVRVKIAVLGGGGFRVPLVYGALLERAEGLGLDELALYDVDEERTERIRPVLEGIGQERGARLPLRTTSSLEDAVEGADFVFCAIRVGKLEGRVVDERVPLDEGVVGQETTGPGGICFALRTVPVMREIAQTVAQRAPHAWFINFTNPAGLVTEAVQEILGGRALGICDTPSALCRRVAGALGRSADELWFDYFGLNHLGWLRGVYDGDRNLLPDLLADDEALATLEEGRLFGAEWLRSLGMIPNEYLYFYYFASDTVGAIGRGLESRAEYLLRQQGAFYESNGRTPADALAAWRATRAERERTYFEEARTAAGIQGHGVDWEDVGGYEGEALAAVEAIALNRRCVLILDTANRSGLPFLDERAVVEVPCVVGSAGAVPTAVGAVPGHARALIETIKEVERTAIRAAISGSRSLAIEALALHPLVPSVTTARRIFDAYASRQPELAARFGP
jgi:6-phospho-beta-glucosidase